MRLLVLCLVGMLVPACISGEWRRVSINEPIPERRLGQLEPDRDDLRRCLATLGAPNRVWESADRGIALSYGWLDQAGWGIKVSYSVEQYASVSYSFDSDTQNLYGVVLLLDEDLILRKIRRGYLRDITADLMRKRPASVEELEGE